MAANPNDITAYRNKKKRRGFLYKISAIGLIVFGVLFIWFNAETIFEPLRGIGSKITTKTSDKIGFPVKLPGSASYSLAGLGTNFSLLTDTYLYTYTSDGAQVYALQHGYTNPVQKTTDRRILIYNHDSHEFSLYNKSSKLYEVKTEEKIVYAALDKNDAAAIVTTSSLYSNELYIYDGNGKWKYTRRFGDEKVNAVTFVSGTDEVYVATANVTDGDITSYIYRFKYSTDGDEVWKCALPAGSLIIGLYETNTSITALCDNLLAAYTADGEYIGSYNFGTGTLQKPVIGRDFSVLILSDYVTGKTSALSFDNSAGLIASAEIGTLKKVEISENMVYTLEGGFLKTYDRFLVPGIYAELDEEYENFIKTDNKILLLGYEEVDMIVLN